MYQFNNNFTSFEILSSLLLSQRMSRGFRMLEVPTSKSDVRTPIRLYVHVFDNKLEYDSFTFSKDVLSIHYSISQIKIQPLRQTNVKSIPYSVHSNGYCTMVSSGMRRVYILSLCNVDHWMVHIKLAVSSLYVHFLCINNQHTRHAHLSTCSQSSWLTHSNAY